MTADAIRSTRNVSGRNAESTEYWLREIAAQLAEMNAILGMLKAVPPSLMAEQPEREPERCTATEPVGDRAYRCDKPSGHSGPHACEVAGLIWRELRHEG